MEVCNYNKENHDAGTALNSKSAMFRTDAAKHEARVRLQKNNLKVKLFGIVADYTLEELEGLAIAMNVPFPDKNALPEDSFEAEVMGVRDRFNRMIDYDPKRFEDEVKADTTRLKTVIGLALRDKIISYDALDRTFYNEIGGKTKILSVPSYADKISYFVELATTRTEYKEAYQDIKKLVERGRKNADNSYKRTNAHKLLTRAMELGIVNNNLGTLVANNIGELGEPMSGIQGATHFLQENKGKYSELEDMIKVLDIANEAKKTPAKKTTTKK